MPFFSYTITNVNFSKNLKGGFIMTLTEYILENVSLFDYYDNFITTLDDRFKEYSYNNSKLVLCYFKDHEDVNPSMGWIHDKHNRDIKVCHCFGCGRTANVVRLHQMLCSQWLNKELTEKDACYDLAQLFGVSLDEFDELEDDDFEGKYEASIRRERRLQKAYTIQDFKYRLKDIRLQNEGLERLNSECVKLIATKNQLYN